MQRKLEKTLSGILDPAFLSPKAPSATQKAPLKRDLSNIDKLLSDSLSGLDLGKKLTTQRAPSAQGDAPATPKETTPRAGDDRDELLADLDLSFLDETPTSQVLPPEIQKPEGPNEEAMAPPAEGSARDRATAASIEGSGDQRSGAGGQRFGHYTLLERIAVGGMAEVWKARMDGVAGFQKTVAIKKILPHLTENKEFERMFVDEAKLAAELNHPNITHIYDLGVIQDEYYIAMEYVEGRNLRSILDTANRKGMPIPQKLSLLVTSRMASALDYAHRKRDGDDRELGLVHRDVSPQNVLISYEGDIKLCDFGIVKAVSKTSQTKAGALKGKLQYMAPEQAWGREVDGRSDIFSLGTLLFEMLTGSRLFAGDDELAILEKVRECDLREPKELDPTIPDSINSLVTKCLARDPKDRFQSADRLRDEMESCLENLTLRPSNADLAAYLRRLMSAAEPDGNLPTEPTDLADRVARFPLPAAEEADSELEEASEMEKAHQASTVQSELGPLVEAIPPLEEAVSNAPGRPKRWLWIAAALALLAAVLFYFWSRSQASGGAQAVPDPAAPVSAPPKPTKEADPSGPPSLDEVEELSKDPTLPPTVEETSSGSEDESAISSPGSQPADLSIGQEALPASLDQEREKIRQAAAAELKRQETELRRTYEQQQRQLESRLSELENEPASGEPGPPPSAAKKPDSPAAGDPNPPARVPVRPGPGVKPPVLVSMKKPQYPAEARGKATQGEIILSLLVDESGKVEAVRQVAGSHPEPGLNQAATQAARAATFKPATQKGKRVKMWTTLKIPYPM